MPPHKILINLVVDLQKTVNRELVDVPLPNEGAHAYFMEGEIPHLLKPIVKPHPDYVNYENRFALGFGVRSIIPSTRMPPGVYLVGHMPRPPFHVKSSHKVYGIAKTYVTGSWRCYGF